MSVNELGTDKNKADAEIGAGQEAKIISGTEDILTGFTGDQSEVIPILQQVQQKFGYLPQTAMKRIAEFVRVPECTLFGVATFYAQFKLTPTGKNVVRVCRGTACHVRGGDRVLKDVQRHLGIKPGQNTPDMQFALETVACIGACSLAPNMVVNDKIYGNMNSKKVTQVLDSFKEH